MATTKELMDKIGELNTKTAEEHAEARAELQRLTGLVATAAKENSDLKAKIVELEAIAASAIPDEAIVALDEAIAAQGQFGRHI